MADLIIENLTMRFAGVVALDEVSFTVEKGEIFSLIGPNGSGKTTLFNCINGFNKPQGGKIYFNGENDLKIAIPPFIIATLIALAVVYFLEKRIPMVPLLSGVLITLFGGLTIYFDNKIFFYMKPTIINLLFAAVLFFGRYFTQKSLLKIFFQNAFNLEDEGWKKLNYRWIGFFLFIAILNEIVWRTQSEVFWVNFKVWGLLPISFLFAISQVPLMNKYKLK